MFTKSQKVAISFGACITILLTLLVIFQSLDIEFFFVLSLIAFLVISLIYGPFTVNPGWKSRVRMIIAIGVALFAMIVINRILIIL